MDTFAVPNGALVVIGNGKKALVLRNPGDAERIDLRRVSVRDQNKWSEDTEKLVVAEIAKEYTHHPIPEIERLLLARNPTHT